MSTLDRLLNALSRVYDVTPDPVLGLRLTYVSGQMQWTIANDTLSTTVIGGTGGPLSVDLSQYTLSTLAVLLASQPGYAVLYLDDQTLGDISTLALVPGSGDIATSNGDHFYVAANLTWIYLAAVASELSVAQIAIEAAPAEMATTSADGEWLDLLGSYYAVPRQLGEQDAKYAPRIPAEVILPRQNNVAIAAALIASTGQPATCTDAPTFGNPFPIFDGAIQFVGAPFFYNAQAQTIYNLFDVAIGYDLLGSLSPIDFATAIRSQIDRLRAAGTHLRDLTLTASVMGDRFIQPTDGLVETILISGMSGTGSSADSGFAPGIFPTLLVPLSFSSDVGLAALSAGISLVGTGTSVDSVSFGILAAGASSSDTGSAVLRAGAGAALAGTGGGTSLSFGTLGTAFVAFGTGISINSALGGATGGGFSLGFSGGFAIVTSGGSGAVLRTGVTFATVGASADTTAPALLQTAIKAIGTSTSTEAGALDSSRLSPSGGGGADSTSAALTSHITLLGSASGSDAAGTAMALDPFSVDFGADFGGGGLIPATLTTSIRLAATGAGTDASSGALSSGIKLVTNISSTDSTSVTLTTNPTGPSATGSLATVDFTNLPGQTVPRTVWGIGTALYINNWATLTPAANPTFNALAASLNMPLFRLNAQSGSANAAGYLSGGVFISGASSPNWSFMTPFLSSPVSAGGFIPTTCLVVLGATPTTAAGGGAVWSTSDYQSIVTQTINWMVANAPNLNLWGWEVGNETNQGTQLITEAQLASYVVAAKAGIAASNKTTVKILGPVASFAANSYIQAVANTGDLDVCCYHMYVTGANLTAQQIESINSELPATPSAAAPWSYASQARTSLNGSTAPGKATLPLMMGEWNCNDVPGINTLQTTYVGAVFNAAAMINALNGDKFLQYGANWEFYADADYGLIQGSGSTTMIPSGYVMKQGAAKVFGTRGTETVVSPTTTPLSILGVSGGNGAGSFSVMAVNTSDTAAVGSGTIGLSHWPVNSSGTATVNVFTFGVAASPTGTFSTASVTSGLLTITLAAHTGVIIYSP